MRSIAVLALIALGALGGCKPEPAGGSPDAASTTVTSATPSASTSAPPPAGPRVFSGSYTATAGALFVPDGGEWKGVKFRGDDAGALGEGTISLTLDDDGGAVSGTLEGPLGPATLTGVTQNDALSFHLAPKDPAAGDAFAFSGTGTGALADGGVTGELHVSSWRANVLRDATFSAAKK